MIIIAPAYALALAAAEMADAPCLLWDNRVTPTNIAADTAASGYPATNLANPNTASRWQAADTSEQVITVTLDPTEATDAVGLARHNFGSGIVTLSLEGLPPDGDPEDDGDWDELIGEFIAADDKPILLRFEPEYLAAVRLRMQPVATVPRLAVLYVGEALVMERGVQPHTPLPFGRRRTKLDGWAMSGDYLGSVVTGSKLASAATFNYLSPDWYRASLDRFADASVTEPFFFAWAPTSRPTEIGYAKLVDDLVPQTMDYAGWISVTFNMEAIAL